MCNKDIYCSILTFHYYKTLIEIFIEEQYMTSGVVRTLWGKTLYNKQKLEL